ncbi:MAG: hypothetical protein ACOC1P_03755, partial [Minisyncoccales bacterium]
MTKKNQNKKEGIFLKSFIGLLKTPYYLYKFVKKTNKNIKEKSHNKEIRKKREKIKPIYNEIKIIKSEKGDYKKWEDKVFNSESEIGIILGARGSGKTSFGIKFLENIYSKTNKKCYAMGFKKENMPLWINNINDISEIKN